MKSKKKTRHSCATQLPSTCFFWPNELRSIYATLIKTTNKALIVCLHFFKVFLFSVLPHPHRISIVVRCVRLWVGWWFFVRCLKFAIAYVYAFCNMHRKEWRWCCVTLSAQRPHQAHLFKQLKPIILKCLTIKYKYIYTYRER